MELLVHFLAPAAVGTGGCGAWVQDCGDLNRSLGVQSSFGLLFSKGTNTDDPIWLKEAHLLDKRLIADLFDLFEESAR